MQLTRELEVRDLRNLTSVIQQQYNYDFSQYAKASFKRRIERVMELKRIPTTDELIRKIKQSPDFFESFLCEITVNTTEMFRDPGMWRKLRDEIVPAFKRYGKIRIWHAGCSSGEEVYSLAILLKEAEMLDKASIYATDIDQKIISNARSGAYHISRMDLNNSNYDRFGGSGNLKDYYKEVGDKAVFETSLIKNVKFKVHNLVSDEQFMKFDLILCRNVMIYFDNDLQRKVIKLLHQSCFLGGYLAIGSKETIQWLNSPESGKFHLAVPKESIYKKSKD